MGAYSSDVKSESDLDARRTHGDSLDLTATDASCADIFALAGAFVAKHSNLLNIDIEAAAGFVMRMADIVPADGALTADRTFSRHLLPP